MDHAPTKRQQLFLWTLAAVVGLALAALLHAGLVAAVGLVAVVGIIVGFGFAAAQRIARSSGRDPD